MVLKSLNRSKEQIHFKYTIYIKYKTVSTLIRGFCLLIIIQHFNGVLKKSYSKVHNLVAARDALIHYHVIVNFILMDKLLPDKFYLLAVVLFLLRLVRKRQF